MKLILKTDLVVVIVALKVFIMLVLRRFEFRLQGLLRSYCNSKWSSIIELHLEIISQFLRSLQLKIIYFVVNLFVSTLLDIFIKSSFRWEIQWLRKTKNVLTKTIMQSNLLEFLSITLVILNIFGLQYLILT